MHISCRYLYISVVYFLYLKYFQGKNYTVKNENFSGGSRNFKMGGRGPGAVEFFGLGFVLMPLQTYPMCL